MTPARVAEIHGRLAVCDDRLERLEARLERLERRAELGFALARGRLAAELTVLKRAEGT